MEWWKSFLIESFVFAAIVYSAVVVHSVMMNKLVEDAPWGTTVKIVTIF